MKLFVHIGFILAAACCAVFIKKGKNKLGWCALATAFFTGLVLLH